MPLPVAAPGHRMPTPWKDYLAVPYGSAIYGECQRRCGGSFAGQRDIMRRVFEATRPKVVACLGAGVLNDIPYQSLVRAGATIHLVDWLPGIVDAGIARSIIARDDDGAPDCVYCHLADERARTYCRHFRKPREPSAKVCENFVAGPGDPPICTAFDRSDFPVCHQEDVTEGYASAFAENVVDALREVRSWRQALAQANALAKRVRRHRTSLGIDTASVDLATSSMVVSQFEHEPYQYFSRQAAGMLGPPTRNEERRLEPAMETLRATLLSNQIERHCEEIARILAPGGRCLMSFELFHLNRETGRWFLVDEMHGALQILARRFDFDFDILPEERTVTRVDIGDSASLVHSFVLEPRAA